MFKILVNKQNNDELKKFIIPKNESYNCSSWVLITVKGKNEFIMERFSEQLKIVEEEWELKSNYAFPSALMNEFLRLDYNDNGFKVYL